MGKNSRGKNKGATGAAGHSSQGSTLYPHDNLENFLEQVLLDAFGLMFPPENQQRKERLEFILKLAKDANRILDVSTSVHPGSTVDSGAAAGEASPFPLDARSLAFRYIGDITGNTKPPGDAPDRACFFSGAVGGATSRAGHEASRDQLFKAVYNKNQRRAAHEQAVAVHQSRLALQAVRMRARHPDLSQRHSFSAWLDNLKNGVNSEGLFESNVGGYIVALRHCLDSLHVGGALYEDRLIPEEGLVQAATLLRSCEAKLQSRFVLLTEHTASLTSTEGKRDHLIAVSGFTTAANTLLRSLNETYARINAYYCLQRFLRVNESCRNSLEETFISYKRHHAPGGDSEKRPAVTMMVAQRVNTIVDYVLPLIKDCKDFKPVSDVLELSAAEAAAGEAAGEAAAGPSDEGALNHTLRPGSP